MIRNVTHSACGRPGSVSTEVQLVRPDGVMTPMPSHVVKERPTTPTSGMTPKATKTMSAGSAIHATEELRPAPETVEGTVVRAPGGASAVTAR